MAVSKIQIPFKGFEAILINQTISLGANSDLTIDVSSYLPSGKTAFYACGALARYQMPYVADGVVKTWISTVFQNEVTISAGNIGGWSNTPLSLIVFYA